VAISLTIWGQDWFWLTGSGPDVGNEDGPHCSLVH